MKKTEGKSVLSEIVEFDDIVIKFDKQQEILNFMIHTADISSPGKDFKICEKWTINLVAGEFFNQGDIEREKGVPISFMCDRNTVDIPKAQFGYINSIILPLFKLVSSIMPKLSFMEINAEINAEKWKQWKQIDSKKKTKEERKK